MNTPAENAFDIDDLLEQVALAMASGENDTALKLLPQIMATGDDIQKQMAESYQMQLETLIALEQENAELSQLIGQEEDYLALTNEEEMVIGDDLDGLDDIDSLADYVPDENDKLAISPDESAGDDRKHDHKHLAALAADNETTVADADSSTVAEIQITDSEEQFSAGTDNVFKTVTEDSVKDSIADSLSDSVINSSETQELTAREQQINMALEQIAVLIEEHKYETADMLLQSILPKVNAAQQELAKTYTAAIEAAGSKERPEAQAQSALPETATLEKHAEEQTAAVAEPVDKDSDKDQHSDSILDRLFADEDPDAVFDQLFADEDLQSASDKLFVDDSDQTQSETSDSKAESSVTQSFVVNVPESETQHDSNSNILTNSETVSKEAVSANNNEITEQTGTAEIFSDNESVEGLLPPSQALDAFVFADIDALPEQSTTTEAKNQRQGFLIGNIGLMIDFADGSELTEIPTCYRVPNSPVWMTGLTNLHGVVIPVFDLQKYFNLPADSDKKSMLMVLQHEEKAIGIIVNGLPTRLSYSESQRMTHNTSPSNLRQYIQSAYLINQRLWFELDSSSLAHGLEQAMA